MLITSERLKSFRGFFYLALLFFSFPSYIQADYDESFDSLDEEQRQEKKQELDKLRQRMSVLRQSLQQKQQEKDSASKFLKDIEVRIGERAYVLRKINRHLRKQKRELTKLKNDIFGVFSEYAMYYLAKSGTKMMYVNQLD